jgi:hypothetical protein
MDKTTRKTIRYFAAMTSRGEILKRSPFFGAIADCGPAAIDFLGSVTSTSTVVEIRREDGAALTAAEVAEVENI